jgi:glycosyltransferase involved in cell wall biosynthesis
MWHRRAVPIRDHDLVAVIPCKNEQGSIVDVITDLRAIGVERVVIGLDPGSADDTAVLAEQSGAVVIKAEASGYDAPCLAAINHLQFDGFAGFVLFLDAGNKYEMDSVGAMLDSLDGACDLTFGIRDAQTFWHQRLGNFGYRCALFARYRHWAKDISSVRVVRMESLIAMRLEDRQFSLPFQTIVHGLVLGHCVSYTPIRCRKYRVGESKVSGDPRNSLRAFRQMLRSLRRVPPLR